MIAVDLKTLKNKLSEYVRAAARGEVVLITGPPPRIPVASWAALSSELAADRAVRIPLHEP